MSVGMLFCLAGIIWGTARVPICRIPQMAFVGRGELATALLAQLQSSPAVRPRPVPVRAADGNTKRLQDPAGQRIQARRILQEQIRKWRVQAREIPPHSVQQALEEKPEPGEPSANSLGVGPSSEELEAIVRSNVEEVVLQFVKEMRIPGDAWEKAHVGRALVALLERGFEDQLAGQDKVLVRVFISGPKLTRELPQPKVRFRQAHQTELDQPQPAESEGDKNIDENSEAYLIELRRAQEDAEKRNAQDERTMWSNQAVELFYGDLTALVIRSRSYYGYKAVIDRINQQVGSKDVAFQQTVEALGRAQLSQLSLKELKWMQGKLGGLARRFRGERPYIVYTEVERQVRTQSSFGQRKLDFSNTVGDLLVRLTQQIEAAKRREPLDRLERTPSPEGTEPLEELERTPGPEY